MTKEQMRIVVAEIMGWTKCLIEPAIKGEEEFFPERVTGFKDGYGPLSNYPEDLNACAEFESTLTEEQCQEYGEILCKIVTPLKALFPPFINPPARRYVFHASPLQRTEAFIRLHGRWVE